MHHIDMSKKLENAEEDLRSLRKENNEKVLSCFPIISTTLWNEILDFLDSPTFFRIVPYINKFLYSRVSEFFKYRTSISYQLSAAISNSTVNDLNDLLNHRNQLPLGSSLNFSIRKLSIFPKTSSCETLIMPASFSMAKTLEIPSFRQITVLKLANVYLNSQVFASLSLLQLKVLKFDECNSLSATDLNEYLEISKHHLVKLSISRKSSTESFNLSALLEKIDDLPGLKKLTLRRSFSSCLNYYVLNHNFALETIKFIGMVYYRYQSISGFFDYISNHHGLKCLHLHEGLVAYLSSFIPALSKCCSLEKLAIYSGEYEHHAKATACTELLNYAKGSKLVDLRFPLYNHRESRSFKNFLIALEELLIFSQFVERVDIYCFSEKKIVKAIAETIIKNAPRSKMITFMGFPVRAIFENSCEIYNIKGGKFVENNFPQVILVIAKRILRIKTRLQLITENYHPLATININAFVSKLKENKKLKLTNDYSEIYAFYLLLLASQTNWVESLNIDRSFQKIGNHIWSALKLFKNLHHLKLSLSENCINASHFDIIRLMFYMNKSVYRFTLDFKYEEMYIETFNLLKHNPIKTLEHLTLKNIKMHSSRFMILTTLISVYPILKLTLKNCEINEENVISLISFIETNKSLISLKLNIDLFIEPNRRSSSSSSLANNLLMRIVESLSFSTNYIQIHFSSRNIIPNSENNAFFIKMIKDIISNNKCLEEMSFNISCNTEIIKEVCKSLSEFAYLRYFNETPCRVFRMIDELITSGVEKTSIMSKIKQEEKTTELEEATLKAYLE
jgi:hypothetical protein